MKTMTNLEFTKKFNDMERDNGLFELTFDNIYIWKQIRIHLFNELRTKIFKLGSPHPNQEKSNNFSDKIKELILRKRFSGFKYKGKSENIVIRHRRRILVDKKYIEVNTEYLKDVIKDLADDNTEYIEYHFAYKFRNIDGSTKIVSTNPIFVAIYKAYFRVLRYREITKLSDCLQSIFEGTFNIRIDVRKMIIDNLAWFNEGYRVYKKYFKLKAPKKVYLVCSYGKEYIIKAAHDIGAEILEIQHGIIGPDHMGYSFPYNNEIPYFPDKVYVYGDYWKDIVHFPVCRDNIISIGNPYYLREIKKHENIKKKENQILFISSGEYGKNLAEIAIHLLEINHNVIIIFKLHPSEFGVWKEKYEIFGNVSGNSNLSNRIEVVEDEIPLYNLFASSKYIAGVNSTAIFESLFFNPILVLFNIASLENMKILIDKYNVPVLNSAKDLDEYIEHNWNSSNKIDSNYFYKLNR